MDEATEDSSGEELYKKARAISHRRVPAFDTDGPYLELLYMAADKGHAPALAKLGEYAMRRAAWVEAYYWMSMAKRSGMENLGNVMWEIRKQWSLSGCRNESSNINSMFSAREGSIGRALLHIDTGYSVLNAREFLRQNYPEFL